MSLLARPPLRGHDHPSGEPKGACVAVDDVVGDGAAALAAALHHLPTDRRLRVWCVGAGGLAEPLTVALLANAAGLGADIVATDVDAAAVNDIQAGRIPGRRLRMPASVIGGALVADADGFRPAPALAVTIRGAIGDPSDVPGGQPFDLIICRDVLHHYRPAFARQMVRDMLAACAPGGVVMLNVVDALAAGRPLSGEGVIALDHTGAPHGADVERLLTAPAAHPMLRLAALCDASTEIRRRQSRLLSLAGDCPELVEARLTAAAVSIEAGQLEAARAMLEAIDAGALEGDRACLLAIVAMQEGRAHEARQLLSRAAPTSWLGPYLMGMLLRRLHRPHDATPFLREAVRRLAGPGTAPVGSVFLANCSADHVGTICDSALRSRTETWHGA